MTRVSRFRALAVMAGALVVALACGPETSTTQGNKGTIVIGVDLPQSGAEASSGVPTFNGIKFAVQEKGTLKGFKLDVTNFDDAVNGVHDPQKGAQNVQQMLSNPDLLAMVGPFNSNVARAEIPIANAAELLMVSPANTNECLTRSFPYCDPQPDKLRPQGKPNSYYRVAATDNRQGPAVADYAYDQLKIAQVAVSSDNETYGKGIADTFAKQFQSKNGKIVSRQDFDTKSTSDFRPFLTSAKNAGAQGVFFGGVDANKACIVRAQMKGIFDANIPFLGGDGIVTQQCVDDAADNAINVYGSVAAVDANFLPEAKATIEAFKKAFPGSDAYGAYTIPGYASAQAVMRALEIAIDKNNGNKPSRAQLRDAMKEVKDLKTPIGTISFDQYGDIIPQIITIYQTKEATADDAAKSPSCNKAQKICFVYSKEVKYTS